MTRREFDERSGRAAGPEMEGPEPEVNDRPTNASAGPEPIPETVEELREAVERYKAEAERNWAQFLHAAADLENYKKQATRAREDAVQRARRSLLTVVLSVLDNLERALTFGDQDARAIREGIQLTHRQVMDLLGNLGVRPLATTGERFDPRYHEAVETVEPSEEYPEGTVAGEVQRGYLIGDEVLRPARVRVAQSR